MITVFVGCKFSFLKEWLFKVNKIKIDFESGFLIIVALLTLTYSFYLAVFYAGQPLLDGHSFRQTQTALTSYWFINQGFQFAYETPVAGAPWAIPFEFPIYQVIVACISKEFNVGLDETGRMISYLFLLLTILPVIAIVNRLSLPKVTSFYFIAILFSMPIYVYWGRAFLIETTALFFGIVAIKYFVDYLIGDRSIAVSLKFILFASLCILQKTTTALPILVILSIVFFVFEMRRYHFLQSSTLVKSLFLTGIIFLIPIIIGYTWVVFTDQVKLGNPLGQQLTSAAIGKWNWGTLEQRFSFDLWIKVLGHRIFNKNLASVLGVAILVAPLFFKINSNIKVVLLITLSMGLLPLLFFPNLHIVHDYYQSSNAIFFAFAVSLVLSALISPKFGKKIAIVLVMIVILFNHAALHFGYLPNIKKAFTKKDKELAIGGILKREIPLGMQFIAFGNDWSSALSYFSERKSFTVPKWFDKYDIVLSNPAEFLEQGRLGAIVSCGPQELTSITWFNWIEKNGPWKIGQSHDCLIVTPEKKITNVVSMADSCIGQIERADIEVNGGRDFLVFSGWLAGYDLKAVDFDAFIKVSGYNMNPEYLQILRIPKVELNRTLKVDEDIDLGFSRIVENKFKSGTYQVELFQKYGNDFRSCGIRKTVEIR